MVKIFFLCAICFFQLTGCTSYGPFQATSNDLKGAKLGQACKTWAVAPIPIFTWGRNDIMTAALSSNIQQIAVIDHSEEWNGVYGKSCTLVYGR